jgi:DNA polymerase
MLIAAPKYRYISSDYDSIEAVVMACMAGEPWIIEVYLTDGKLYERTGANITGISLEKIITYKSQTGLHHKARKIGKVASLASQYQGARGAWLKFGAGKFLTNKEIDKGVQTWREKAPNIVAYWHSIENAATRAVLNPGILYPVYQLSGIATQVFFQQINNALRCILPNGEYLTYMNPSIKPQKKLSKEGWDILKFCENICDFIDKGDPINSEAEVYKLEKILIPDNLRILNKIKSVGYSITPSVLSELTKTFFNWVDTLFYWGVDANNRWVEISTYGGKLAENITQSVARFILSNAMLNVEAAGYTIVMHKHDDIVTEIPNNFGSLEELESLMSVMPSWAKLPDGTPWPIKATGGWEGERLR